MLFPDETTPDKKATFVRIKAQISFLYRAKQFDCIRYPFSFFFFLGGGR